MIKSIVKAVDILQLFDADEPRLALMEIANRLDMPKGTVHNMLSTLLSCGLVERTDDERYALGTTIIALTQAVRINAELRDRAAPLLRELADACRESAYLVALDGDYALYIYAVESPQRLLARTAVGDRVPLHCTSTGKAILSGLTTEEIAGIVSRAGLPRFTEATVTDIKALHREMEQARERGYSIDRGEHEASIYCVGAPVLDARGRVIGSCSISGLDAEIIGGRLQELSSHVMHTAQQISRRMGYVPASPSSVVSEPAVVQTTEAIDNQT
jgi:DNA-binding IclR family transcriptional regulator